MNYFNSLYLTKKLLRILIPKKTRKCLLEIWKNFRQLFIRKIDFTNHEMVTNYQFSIYRSNRKKGVSALLRVKNEAEKISYCIKSILDVFDEIIFVDNNSEDQTFEIVWNLKASEDVNDKIKIYSYPFKISRCGEEHFDTPENSVHNLSYYYNWCLSRCSYKYVCKWDGDMILKKESRIPFQNFLRDIQSGKKHCWNLQGQTIYRDTRNNIFLAKEEINYEIMIFPYEYTTIYHKINLFEALQPDPRRPVSTFHGITFYELKYVTENEFSHWSSNDFVTERKITEWRNFNSIKSGQIDEKIFEKLPKSFLKNEMNFDKPHYLQKG